MMHQMVRSPLVTPSAILTQSLVTIGDTIASEGMGEYMYVEGRVLDTHGKPVPNATIETWETDSEGTTALFGILHPHR
jgi:protocatechuate 3,4-dioxygenase beta subunit